MGFSIADLFSGSGNDYGTQAANQEAQRQAAITSGTTAINNAYAGFTPAFYNQYAQSYQDFAKPQLEQQYTSTRNQIGFDLANRNLVGSGAARTRWGNLSDSMATAQQGLVDTGISQANQLQNQVQNTENQQLSYLNQSADPAGATAQATSTAAGFATPGTFAPLADQFTNLLNSYYTSQLINSYKGTQVATPGSFSSGVNFPTTLSGGTQP